MGKKKGLPGLGKKEGGGQVFRTQRKVQVPGLSRKNQGRQKENKMVSSGTNGTNTQQ